MLSHSELRYVLALLRTPNLGDISIKKLLATVGSAEGIFNEKNSRLAKIEGIGQFRIRNLHRKNQLEAADREMRFIQDNQIDCYYFLDKRYPELLKHCIDGPSFFLEKGISICKTEKSSVWWE